MRCARCGREALGWTWARLRPEDVAPAARDDYAAPVAAAADVPVCDPPCRSMRERPAAAPVEGQ